ncbi:MAG: LysM peptidoglycan-binding domain-containing protein [Alphaproteobacteria bacterium]
MVLIAATATVGLRREPEGAAPQSAVSHPVENSVAPSAAGPASPTPRGAKPPSFDVVTVDRAGRAVIAGRAAPGDRVRVLDGDTSIGEVGADARGEWVLVPAAPIAPGNRQFAVEAMSPDGGTVRRSPDTVALSVAEPSAEPGAGQDGGSGGTSAAALLPAGKRASPHEPPQAVVGNRIAAPLDPPDRLALPGVETHVVERGNNLWRIARRHYGSGIRYTAIYEANQDMVRDPELIYPGQELRLPQR